jgi:hypothetical protein
MRRHGFEGAVLAVFDVEIFRQTAAKLAYCKEMPVSMDIFLDFCKKYLSM